MPTFKVGDVVRRVKCGCRSMPLGFTGKVISTISSGRGLVFNEAGAWLSEYFTLVDEPKFEGNI